MEAKTKTALYESMLSRDPRNDGRFYVGVRTTGIYCRPICPAKPKFENVEFYRSKAEAEKAGFCPCLRCRPDVSPLSIRWQGTAAVINRALKILEKVDQEGGELSEVADRLGMTDRHLRRLFEEHLGASPIEVAISRRLHLARQLLVESKLSILDVAMASGFGSLRRFNDAFLKAYKSSPSEFQKKGEGGAIPAGDIAIALPYAAPYDWDNLLAFFKRHQAIGIEHFEDDLYLRHFRSRHGLNVFTLRHNPKKSCFDIKLKLASLEDLRPTIERIRSQFDVSHNPFHIHTEDPVDNEELQTTIDEVRGMRIPGSFDAFEVAISIILSQLVSTERARELLKIVIERYGEKVSHAPHPALTHVFPTPYALMHADFAGVGVTRVRAEAIRGLAKAVFEGAIDLSQGADLEKTRRDLLAIKGLGPWTVEAIAMRCLSDANAFPAKDLIVARALQKFEISQEFLAPWRAYLTLAIWKTQAHLLTKKGKKAHDKNL